MTDRYPGCDVLTKQWSLSWNEITREVVRRRLDVPRQPRFLSITEHWNYDDRKDFAGGYCWMAQGPLPVK